MRHLVAHLIGRPDGLLHRLRCGLLGHEYEVCTDVCCEGRKCWCARCGSLERQWDAPSPVQAGEATERNQT